MCRTSYLASRPAILPGVVLAAILACAGCDDAAERNDQVANPAVPVQTATTQAALQSLPDIAAGKQALATGDYQTAVDRFTRALAEGRENQLPNPGAPEAELYYQRGVAFLRMGFPDTAIEDFSAALNIIPDHGPAFQQRARAYVELRDSYKSLRDATQAIRLTADNSDAYRLRGEVYLQRGQYERASADLQYAVDKKPELAGEVKPLLAVAYAKWSDELAADGDETAAAAKLAHARELDPTARTTAATTEAAPPAAIEQTVAKPVIDDAQRHFAAGREHQLANELDQAIIDYTEAIAMKRDFDEAFLRRGETLLTMGFPDTALEDFKRANHRGASSVEAHRLEARAHMAIDNPHRAALAATEALHGNPTDAATYALRGEAYLEMEVWDRAIADLEEAIRRDPALKAALEPKLAAARQRQDQARKAKLQTIAAR
jgi:tetratricopeptide (TPR) repeat protein